MFKILWKTERKEARLGERRSTKKMLAKQKQRKISRMVKKTR